MPRRTIDIVKPLIGKAWALHVRLHTKYLADVAFVHINKAAGSSIEKALGLPFQHKTARELRDLMGPRRWSERFTFTFVRNPWDKVASHYHYRVMTDQTGLATSRLPFNDWVMRAYGERDPLYYDIPKMFMPQIEWIVDDDRQLMVDFIGHFENLEDDFHAICDILGVGARLPHLKRSVRGDYRELYTAEAAEVVERWFAEDLKRFEYRF